jgi:hypothetical protein
MYYHFAILLLFRPLIKLRIIGSSISPRDVCSQAADAISGLLRSYSQLYTLRRTPSFVPYFVLTSSIMHLAISASSSSSSSALSALPPVTPSDQSTPQQSSDRPSQSQSQVQTPGDQTQSQQQGGGGGRGGGGPKITDRVKEAISRGIADLTEMAPCHHFAEQALNILRYLAKKWNIEVDIKAEGEERGLAAEELEQLERATRPVTSSLNFFAPNVADADFNCTWGAGSGSTGLVPGPGPGPVEAAVAEGAGGGGFGAAGGGLGGFGGGGDGGDDDGGGGTAPAPGDQGMGGHDVVTGQMANAMENPLFWPFPMQGRPMLPTGRMLEEAGFEMLQ